MIGQSIQITVSTFEDFAQVDVVMNGAIQFELCQSFEVDSENNAWDALVKAKNYAHKIISDWQNTKENA